MSTTLDGMLVKTPEVCGGRIHIDGTRITVHRMATLYKQGQSAEDIGQTYPHPGTADADQLAYATAQGRTINLRTYQAPSAPHHPRKPHPKTRKVEASVASRIDGIRLL